jgi:hypothetical protein
VMRSRSGILDLVHRSLESAVRIEMGSDQTGFGPVSSTGAPLYPCVAGRYRDQL